MSRLGSMLRRGAARAGLTVVRSGAHRVVARDFYSPIPEAGELPAEHFDTPLPMPGVAFDTSAMLQLLEEELAPHIAAWKPSRWHPGNGTYEAVDGEVLYAMVRHLRPRRIVELGSGWSTAVLADAAQGAELRTFDPFPSPVALTEVVAQRAQDVPLEVFTALEEGDILFVDTTHVAKAGSDVNRLVLDVLPRLAPGVAVHFHDIFLPYEYHRSWVEDGPWWNEQYLLQAFLAMNPSYEVLFAAHALLRQEPDRLRAAVPSLREHQPTSFWIRRRA